MSPTYASQVSYQLIHLSPPIKKNMLSGGVNFLVWSWSSASLLLRTVDEVPLNSVFRDKFTRTFTAAPCQYLTILQGAKQIGFKHKCALA